MQEIYDFQSLILHFRKFKVLQFLWKMFLITLYASIYDYVSD